MKARVRVNRTAVKRLLGASVFIPAEIISSYIPNDATEYLDVEIVPEDGGLLLRIGGGAAGGDVV